MENNIEQIIEMSNTPDSPDSVIQSVDQSDVYRHIFNYYDDEDKLVQPITYNMSNPESNKIVRTTLGSVPDEELRIKSVQSADAFFSTHSEDVMRDLGIELDEIWNGQIASLMYTYNGKLQFAETDYYTKSMFSRIPYMESYNVVQSQGTEIETNKNNTPARDMLIPDVPKFNDRPGYCSGGTIGGVIVGINNDGNYEIMLGKRSQEPLINKGRISITPNGLIEPQHLKSENIRTSVKKRFGKELFGYRESGERFFEENVQSIELINGWNLRDASLSIYYAFIIDSAEKYGEFVAEKEDNMEFRNLVRIELKDYEKINEIVDFERMSPSTIPAVMETMKYLSKNSEEIEYQIEKDL